MGLFTKHTIERKTELVPYAKEVKEIKAPTDESIRLLNEMQEKAKKNIIATIRIEQNHLKAVVVYFVDDVSKNSVNYHLKFTLNEKDYTLEGHIDRFEWDDEIRKNYMGIGNAKVFDILHKKFAEVLAYEFTKQSHTAIKNLQW